MRLFVALAPPECLVRELRAVVDPLRALHPELRWSDPVDWHITLAFLGEVPDESRPRLLASLADVAAGSHRLDLRLSGGGRFDDRVLWCGVAGDLERLRSLGDRARQAGRDVLAVADRLPLRPHLTLAYSATDDTGITRAADLLAGWRGSPAEFDRLLLMSAESGRAPRYAVEAAWPLVLPRTA